ncbi:MAG: hypothetical protein V4450_01300 [Bacteroidota bacterium]
MDIDLLDQLVENYTGRSEYALLTRFTTDKQMTLTYHAPTNERAKDYDLYIGYPDHKAE